MFKVMEKVIVVGTCAREKIESVRDRENIFQSVSFLHISNYVNLNFNKPCCDSDIPVHQRQFPIQESQEGK